VNANAYASFRVGQGHMSIGSLSGGPLDLWHISLAAPGQLANQKSHVCLEVKKRQGILDGWIMHGSRLNDI